MSFAWHALWFVVAVSLLVTVHEFGHYWVARRLGFKVLRFSVGFGKPLLRRTAGPDHTEYVVAAIPLGGYVKLLDEREGPVPPQDLDRSFTRRPPWQRIVVLLAGPAFNIIFAILVLWGMFWANGVNDVRPVVGDVMQDSIAAHGGLRSGDEIVAVDGSHVGGQLDVVFDLLDAVSSRGRVTLSVHGREGGDRVIALDMPDREERVRLTEPAALFKGLGFQFWTPSVPAQVRQVVAGGPAERAGLKAGDRILSIDGRPVDFNHFVGNIEDNLGHTIVIGYRRGGVENNARVVVAAERVDGKTIGRINLVVEPVPGLQIKYPPGMLTHVALSPPAALSRAAHEAWSMSALQGRLFWRMVLGQVSMKNLNGPLSIAEYAGDSAEAGIASFMSFLVLISLSLGFLNLLPIPILDGGQIVFQLVEWLKGSPLSDRAQAFGQQIGIALLILLMGVALFNDIARQFS
ncbi:MAG TPA: RIP metalloprotease RseP [Steroidobacteraceae bacterium]|nr:RIP metalloprotease RseP [Steroidobacteraceae bacterium]